LSAHDWIEAAAGEGAFALTAQARRVGADLVVMIHGGDQPHVGAVAAAAPRPSLDDPTRTSATASVIAFMSHKEDMLARQAAIKLASTLEVRVVVTAGMHWERIDAAGIALVEANAAELVERLAAQLQD